MSTSDLSDETLAELEAECDRWKRIVIEAALETYVPEGAEIVAAKIHEYARRADVAEAHAKEAGEGFALMTEKAASLAVRNSQLVREAEAAEAEREADSEAASDALTAMVDERDNAHADCNEANAALQRLRDEITALADQMPPDSGGTFVYADGFFAGYEQAQGRFRALLAPQVQDKTEAQTVIHRPLTCLCESGTGMHTLACWEAAGTGATTNSARKDNADDQ